MDKFLKGNVMKIETATTVAELADGNEAKSANEQEIGNKISDIRFNRQKGANAAFEQGKRFSELRKLTKPYETDKASGLSYVKSVSQTGYAWTTAERYRVLYETVTNAGISADIHLVLADYGCDLAAKRTTTAAGIVRDLPELLTLDVTDEKAVEKMVKQVNDKHPVEKPKSMPPTSLETLTALLNNLKRQPASTHTTTMIEKTSSAIIKTKKETLLSLATAIAPFIGKDEKWAESYVKKVENNSALLDQRYNEAVKFAKSATFLETEEPKTKGDNKQA
jgi:hypothetical protein